MRDLAFIHGKQRKADTIFFFSCTFWSLNYVWLPQQDEELVVGGAASSLCCRAINQANKIKEGSRCFSPQRRGWNGYRVTVFLVMSVYLQSQNDTNKQP